MNPADHRQTIVQGFIAVSLCVGGYMMLVDPVRQDISETQAEISAAESDLKRAEATRDDVPVLMQSLERLKRESEQITQLGRFATDERSLFAEVMRLGSNAGLTVEQLNPAKLARPAQKPTASGEAPKPSKDVAVGYSILVTGTYEGIAAFMQGIRTELGASFVRSVRMSPTSDEEAQLVRALIETEHHSFDASPVLADASAEGEK